MNSFGRVSPICERYRSGLTLYIWILLQPEEQMSPGAYMFYLFIHLTFL